MNMKLIIYFIIFAIGRFCCYAGEDCIVEAVYPEKKLFYHQSSLSSLTVGYLRLDTSDGPNSSQIYIRPYKNKARYIEVFFTTENKMILRENGKNKLGEADLKVNSKVPFWYYILIRLEKDLISISRPGDFVSLISIALNSDLVQDQIQIEITSKYLEFVTFNCLSGCPVFADLGKFTYPSLTLQIYKFYLYVYLDNRRNSVAASKAKVLRFNVSIGCFGMHPLHLLFDAPLERQKPKIEFLISSTNESAFLKYGNETVNKKKILHSCMTKPQVALTIMKASNIFWSFNCTSNRMIRIMKTPIPALVSKPAQVSTLGVGEVAAWAIAGLAICVCIILGLKLVKRVLDEDDTECRDRKLSTSRRIDLNNDGLGIDEKGQSVFYKGIKIPDESVEPRFSYTPSIATEQLYPMEVALDVDRSTVAHGSFEKFLDRSTLHDTQSLAKLSPKSRNSKYASGSSPKLLAKSFNRSLRRSMSSQSSFKGLSLARQLSTVSRSSFRKNKPTQDAPKGSIKRNSIGHRETETATEVQLHEVIDGTKEEEIQNKLDHYDSDDNTNSKRLDSVRSCETTTTMCNSEY